MKHPANYLRTHRKRSGLSQREIAQLLGYPDEHQVSRHERSISAPPVVIALGYEIIFRVPIADLFSDLHRAIEQDIEARLAFMESQLQESTAKGRQASLIARKIEWCWERNNPDDLEVVQ